MLKFNKFNSIKQLFSAEVNPDIFPKVLYSLLLCGLWIYFGFYIVHAAISIIYKYQMDYYESFLLYFSQNIAHGQNVYTNLTNYPFISCSYTPLYPAICAPFVLLFGPSFAIGRTISIISALLIGMIIFLIVKRAANKNLAIIITLIFFTTPIIYWTSLFRVDTLGLLFSFAGLYFIYRYENERRIYLSIPLFLLAIMTKQSLIAAPAAAFIYLFLKNKKSAIIITGTLFISIILIFIIMNNLTNGEFYRNVATLQYWNINLDSLRDNYLSFIQNNAVLFIIAFGMSLYSIIKGKGNIFSYYFFTSAVVAVSVGKTGSSINYFLELTIVSCIMGGFLLHKANFNTFVKKASLVSCIVLVALLVQLLVYYHGISIPTPSEVKSQQAVSVLIKETQGNILTEDAGLALVNDKEPLIDFFEMSQLQERGLWDQSQFIDDIKNKKFSLIILEINESGQIHSTRFTDAMINAMSANYKLDITIGEYIILEPK